MTDMLLDAAAIVAISLFLAAIATWAAIIGNFVS